MKNTAPARTVAVVFSRFGPYHLARLRGAAEVLGRARIGVAGISIAGTDAVYAWDRVDGGADAPATVLFPDRTYESLSESELKAALTAALDRINPVAVALPGWAFSESMAGLDWCRALGRPAILMSESSREDHARLWAREVLKQNLVRRFASALVGGVRHAAYVHQLGMPRAAIFFGYDAVDNAYFAQGAERARGGAEALRREHRLPARYVLTSCRFIAKKNLSGLLRGYALHAAATPGARDLVICGDGPLRAKLQQLAETLGIAARIHWPGFVQYPQLPVYYGLADAFILPSTVEPWGLVVNEAMASSLPVLVADRCGCAPDLVRVGENGFTFNPTDPNSIAAALARLPEDAAALAPMGAASRRIVAGFDPEAFGTGLLRASRLAAARSGLADLEPCGDSV